MTDTRSTSTKACPECKSTNTIYAQAGAPGIGGSWYCKDCSTYFDSTVQVPDLEYYR